MFKAYISVKVSDNLVGEYVVDVNGKSFGGASSQTTAPKMYLTAAIHALRNCPTGDIEILSHSGFLDNIINSRFQWKSHNEYVGDLRNMIEERQGTCKHTMRRPLP